MPTFLIIFSSGDQQSNVPSWEMKFCHAISLMSWRDILLKKKMMRFNCPRVLEWNDSAGEEAFYNAKARYWAKTNNLPCDIPTPKSDTYIEEVDWNSEIDGELLKDLDKCRLSSDVDEDEVCGSARLTINWDHPPPCTGWGDEEETIQPTGWGDEEETIQPTGWGDTADANEPTRRGDTEGDIILQNGWGNAGRQWHSDKFDSKNIEGRRYSPTHCGKVPQNNDRDGRYYDRRKSHAGFRNRASGGEIQWEVARHHRVTKWEWRPVRACNA